GIVRGAAVPAPIAPSGALAVLMLHLHFHHFLTSKKPCFPRLQFIFCMAGDAKAKPSMQKMNCNLSLLFLIGIFIYFILVLLILIFVPIYVLLVSCIATHANSG